MSRNCRLAPCLILLAVLTSRAGAQGWVRTIGGDGHDAASAIERTADGGFVVVGSTASFGDPTERFWVLRLDAAGVVTWQRSLGTGGKGRACRVEQAPDGGFLVAGNSEADSGGPPSLPWMVKLDGGGAITWQRTYIQAVNATLQAIAYLPDGTLAAVGTRDTGRGAVSWILRLDATGAPSRYNEYAVAASLSALDVRATVDGGLLVAGTMGSSTIWLMRLDATGGIIAQKSLSFPIPGSAYGIRLEPCADGGWVVSGYREEGIDMDTWYVPFVLRLDANLTVTWAIRMVLAIAYEGGTADAIRQTADGGYLLAGASTVADGWPSGKGALAIKLDALGRIEWQHAVGPGDLWLTGLAITPDGGGMFVGTTALNTVTGDALLVRVDATGLIAVPCGEVEDAAFTIRSVSITSADTSVVVTAPSASSQPTLAAAVDTTAPLIYWGDALEPDDSCASPTRLIEDETTRHDFCDDPEDWFELLACEGVAYTIMTSSLGPLANTVVDVLSPDCMTTLASDDDGGGGLASRLDWIAPADRSYRVRVRQADGTAGPDRGYDVTLVRSGPGCATWARTYGVLDICGLGDRPSIASHPDGTFVVAGAMGCGVGPTYDDDVVVAALGEFGDVIWQKRLAGPGHQVVTDVETTGSGGLVVAGQSLSSPNYSTFMAALDGAGAILWQKFYQRDGLGAFNWRIRPLRDGGFAAIGDLNWSASRSDLWILRLDSAGIPSWDLLIGGRFWERAGDAIEMADGGLLVFAASDEFGELWMLRLDSTGSVQWQRACTTGHFAVNRAAEAADGGILVASGSSVLKLDRDGVAAWRRDFTRPPSEPFWASDLVATLDGGCVIAGGMESPFNGMFGTAILVKLNAAGHVEWQRDATQFYFNGFLGISQAPDLGYTFTGKEMEDFVVRVDRDGLLRDCPFADAGLVAANPDTSWTDTTAVPIPGSVTVTDASFVVVDRGIAYDETCHGSGATAPWEVSPPGSPAPLMFTDHSTLQWERAAASGASAFNVYRGDLASLRSGDFGACFVSDLPTNGASDPAMPPDGTTWTYLVTGTNAAGEGPMGRNSLGIARVNTSPCP